jgi:general nucleoside transport system permease protein
MTEALIVSILAVTIRAGTSLLYATLGEIVTERVGVMNLGVEGIMIVGATIGFTAAYYSNSVWIGVLAALGIGAVLGCLHAFLTITMRTEQVVTGLALTIFGGGLASYLGQRLGPAGKPLVGLAGPKFVSAPIPILSKLPLLGGSFFSQDVLTYALYVIVPLIWFFLYRTRQGLHLRSVGENPQTADAMGVNVIANRYLYTILGGLLMGLAGAHISLAYTPGWQQGLTSGRGWIAIALVIFSSWNPLRATLGAILFGGINAVQFRLQAMGITIAASFLNMLPYLATIIVLVLTTWWETFRRRVAAPAALGVAYVREERR